MYPFLSVKVILFQQQQQQQQQFVCGIVFVILITLKSEFVQVNVLSRGKTEPVNL